MRITIPKIRRRRSINKSRSKFAWLPVRTVDGKLVWLEHVRKVKAYNGRPI